MRIRVIAETSHSPGATPTATPKGRSEAATPDSGSAAEVNIVSEGPDVGSQDTRSEQSVTVNGRRRESVPGSDSGKDNGDKTGAPSNLVGKMNNLVSTDLENVVSGRDILLLGLSSLPPRPAPFSHLSERNLFPLVLYFPLQVVMCVWFLYNILGWSTFVGMAAMLAVFPIPGTVAGKIQKVQKEVMKRVSIRLISILASGFTSWSDGRACAGCYRK